VASAAGASISAALSLLLEAQRDGEPVAWVTTRASLFYAPDASLNGLDVEAISVVRAADAREAARAAERLLRSGGFGAVVLDLDDDSDVADALAVRLAQLARLHDAVVVAMVYGRKTGAFGAHASLRVAVERSRIAAGRFVRGVQIERARGGLSSAPWLEEVDGPPGLR
jgi:recombination protein RecA